MADFYSLQDAFRVWDGLISRSLDVRKYMEIGVHYGASLGQVLQRFPDMERVVICDNWLYEGGSRSIIEEVIRSAGFPMDRVTFLEGDSKVLVPEYFAENPDEVFDLIFVDADHGKEPCRRDLLNVYTHTNIIVAHDIFLHRYLADVVVEMYIDMQKHDKWWMIFAGHDPHGTAVLVRSNPL